MPRRTRSTKPPRLDAIVHGDLEPGGPDDLESRADLDGLEFLDVSVAELSLDGAVLRDCRLSGLAAREADWRSVRLREVTAERLDIPVLRASRSHWQDVRIEGARLGSAEAYDAEWRSVHFVGCKLGFLNLRAAELLDVAFTDCVIEELDLLDATARRVRFTGTRIASLDLQRGRFEDVDLRGADLDALRGVEGLRGTTISPDQLTLLAPLLAHEAGLRIEDAPR
ncbi:pentapeptide repeat-containing protein [Nocardioides sp. GXZ039]|uniref:pentapeptide repeat-containing protein n=1 Tax=Nocardioides sp. GXZ039 TaxID=3136018 RepID=UPI0030F479A6